MRDLLHELLLRTAERFPQNRSVLFKDDTMNFSDLAELVSSFASGLTRAGLSRQDRIAVYLNKRPETVAAIFGATMAGGVFVPVNPLLKAAQVTHILSDCNVRILVTSGSALQQLGPVLNDCEGLKTVITVDSTDEAMVPPRGIRLMTWRDVVGGSERANSVGHRTIDADMAAIFYTSGSTGKPKGVVLSHRNMVAGARSVAQYLENTASDRLLAALPLSFDYGFSQLSTAFLTGAAVVLMDYLFPKDVLDAAEKYSVTGLAGVPPLWIQLAKRPWPANVVERLRYITNSGGAMPKVTLDRLRTALPNTKVYLMYGLTEAFRSTYLPPDELDRRPDSMGKAIPNAEVMVVRDDGTRCDPDEPGELVHRGALVARGYWNDVERTAKRFRVVPAQEAGIVVPELAVWSGDTVRQDEAGYLYFIGRRDDMIKTSGYRVSPAEIESVIYASGQVAEAVALGVPHPELGQAVVVVAVTASDRDADTEGVLSACRNLLPNYMLPAAVKWRSNLPRNPNGKIDHKSIQMELRDLFQTSEHGGKKS